MPEKTAGALATFKFIVFSLFGLFMFFFKLEWISPELKSFPLDFIINWLQLNFMPTIRILVLLAMYCGAIIPFMKRTWNKSSLSIIMSFIKLLGAVLGTVFYFQLYQGSWLWRYDVAPFLFDGLAVYVCLIFPLGSMFLAFATGYGLVEFCNVFFNRMMQFLLDLHTPYSIEVFAPFILKSSPAYDFIDALKAEEHSERENDIILTGFLTVSITLILTMAKALMLMDEWMSYFLVSVFVTFAVTGITARLWPLCMVPDAAYREAPIAGTVGTRLKCAWNTGINAASKQDKVLTLCAKSLWSGIKTASATIPSLIAVCLLGFWVAKFTPLFDCLGYLFYPFFRVFGISQPFLASKAVAAGLSDMFLPAVLVRESGTTLLKFVIAVVSISEVLFFSVSIPYILENKASLSLREILVIWFERVALSILIALPIGLCLGFSDINIS